MTVGKKKWLLGAVVVALVLPAAVGAQPSAVASSQSVAGADRYGTAVEVARMVGGGSLSGLDRIIIVSGESFPDGLAASGLAGFLDDGGRSGRTAILLTRSGSLPSVVEQAIRASGVSSDRVLVVGGSVAVSEAVRAAVGVAAGWNGAGANPVTRIAGQDRYATAAAIVDYVLENAGVGLAASYRTVLVASGEQFPDALSAGTLAYRNGHLLVLSRPSTAPEATLNAVAGLKANRAVLVGGTTALASAVATQIQTRLAAGAGSGVERIAGRDRYDTAAQVANRFVAVNGAPSEPLLTSGLVFADALTTGPLAGHRRPLLLTAPNQLPESTRTWLQQHQATIDDVRIIGGTNTVNPIVRNQVNNIVAPSRPTPPVYAVGDIGPGGGTVFYVHPGGGTFACGPSLNLTCRYLEAFPTDLAVGYQWKTTDTGTPGTSTVLGSGYANTYLAMAGDAHPAAAAARNAATSAKTDWFLPSKDELNELCKFARHQTTGNTSVACTSAKTLRDGFAVDVVDGQHIPLYWSSSVWYDHVARPELAYDEGWSVDNAWFHVFSNGVQWSFFKSNLGRVRPVRAF